VVGSAGAGPTTTRPFGRTSPRGLSITAISTADSFCVGYTGCRDTLPHLQRIAVYSGEALDELERALGMPARG
jgi:diacylglycerol O-acyltransferase / wax synthase